jgi:hypothetical protein
MTPTIHKISSQFRSFLHQGLPSSSGSTSYVGYKINNQGVPVAPNGYKSSTYDPTTRPWYLAASVTSSWSSFYELTTVSSVVVNSFSVPIYSPATKTLLGVVAVTRHLESYTQLVTKYAASALVIYLMDNTGGLIATSNNETVWKNGAIIKAVDSTNGLVSSSASFLLSNDIFGEMVTTYSYSGTTYTVAATPWSDSTKTLNLQIVSVYPFSGLFNQFCLIYLIFFRPRPIDE